MWINNFVTERLIPGSFSWKVEWSIRTVFPFIISAIVCIYFDKYLLVPFLLPIIVLVVCNASIGTSFHVFASVHKGGFFVSIISSIFYWIPFATIHWSFCLIYFCIASFIFAVLLHKNAGSLKVGMAFHVINTLQFVTTKEMKFYDIWWLYSILPITLVICFIGLYFPFFKHNFGTLHVLYCETQLSVKLCQDWVNDMFSFFLNCNIDDDENESAAIAIHENSISQSHRMTRVIDSKHRLVRAKLQKYLALSNKNKSQIYKTVALSRGIYIFMRNFQKFPKICTCNRNKSVTVFFICLFVCFFLLS